MSTPATGEPEKQSWGTLDTLSAKVPVATVAASPSAVWLIEAAKVLIPVVLNHKAYETGEKTDVKESELWKRAMDIEARLNTGIAQARYMMGGGDTVGEVPIPLTSTDPIDPVSLETELKMLLGELKIGVDAAIGVSEPIRRAMGREFVPKPLDIQAYKDIYKVVELPKVANDFDTDERFAKYRIAAQNPMLLRGVTKKEVDALTGYRITDQKMNAILKTVGDSVERAGNEGRLCVLNYELLSCVDTYVEEGPFIGDPIAVFVEPMTTMEKAVIKPIAIQLGQDPATSEIVFANTDDTYRWKMAKHVVQVADTTYHEIIAHLAHTHLMTEPFAIATTRNLKPDHPIAKLLTPHFDGTNFINRAAAGGLIAPSGPIDDIFCNERPSRLRTLQQLAVYARLTFDFQKQMPDMELKSRNIDKLKVFPYRDDVILLWDAILRWVEQYVDLYYESENDVLQDEALMAWYNDLLDNAHIRNFHKPTGKKTFVRTLSMVIFLASAQHAAVNFPQFTDMSFAPSITGAVWEPFPDPAKGPATEKEWLEMMPPLSDAREQLSLLLVIGGVMHRRLGQYHQGQFPFLGSLDKKVEPALKSFHEELAAIETIINARNKQRGYYDYHFLLPSQIPASINI